MTTPDCGFTPDLDFFLLAEDQLFRDQLLGCYSLYLHLLYRSDYKTIILTDVLVIASSLKSFVLTTI